MSARSPSIAALLALAFLAGSCGGGSSSGRVSIQSKGSDTLLNVAQTWAEKYRTAVPGVSVAVSGGGSGTGISSLINGTIQIANSSREMTEKELDLAKKKGIAIDAHVVGYDALAVYVHRDNPVKSLTLAQLAEIYGEGGKVTTWGDLGVEVPGARDGKIVLVSRQNNSGTYIYFREAVLGESREYRLGSLDLHGSTDVVDLVAKTPGAIGYSGLAYATDAVRMVPIAKAEGEAPVEPTEETALSGTYPIARPLFMMTRKDTEPHVKAYIDWILSETGQAIIAEKGYAPARRGPRK